MRLTKKENDIDSFKEIIRTKPSKDEEEGREGKKKKRKVIFLSLKQRSSST